MIKRAFKFLAGLALTLMVGVGVASAAHVDWYVDMGCTNNGNGLAIDCASSVGGAGPKNDITTATLGSVACDTTIHIRGVHATHGSNHGNSSATGRYFVQNSSGGDYIDIHGKACTSGTPIIIQPYGYTTAGTGEVVYIDGSVATTWSQCTWDGAACDCDAGNQNVQIGAGGSTACTETWYATGTATTGAARKALGFQKPDGSPTYRVASLALMTNASAGYNAKACSDVGAVDYTWMRCNTNSDCPTSSTCTAAQSSEVDSFSTEAIDGVGLARWASTPAASTHRVFTNDDNYAFFIYNSSFITIRGFNFRGRVRPAVGFENAGGPTLDSTITDNRIYYACYQKNSGPDYGIEVKKSNRITVSYNNIGYTTSEGIHTQSQDTGATVYNIVGNWIHDIGDQTVLGPQCSGTPSGSILTDDYSGGEGNYTGSTFDGNLIQRPATHDATGGSVGRGMIIEDDSSGWLVTNNVIDTPAGECIKLDGSVSASSNIFYNNVLINCGNNYGPAGGAGTCIYIYANSGSGIASSNQFWNNTLYNCAGHGIVEDCGGAGTCNSNIFRNNILNPAAGKKGISWTKTGTTGNLFEYNDSYSASTPNPVITWLNTGYACGSVASAGTGNICVDPGFADTTTKNFHITSGSSNKNAGTSTGMPAGRTTDIYNSLAVLYGLADYRDGVTIQSSIWDIGADEFSGTDLCAGVTCTALDQCHTAGTCNPATGVCNNPQKADGTTCSDSNACTQTDTCQAGTCTGANPVICTASDQCHDVGTCNTSTGACSNPNKTNGTTCNDSNACTQTDTCQTGVCTGSNPVVCSGDQCHDAGTCNPANGVCSTGANKANGTSCSDGSLCTLTDTCQTGVCTGGSVVTCTALDQCHNVGTCNASTGVCSNPLKGDGAACTDSNACTVGDTCTAGVCISGTAVTCTALDQCHNVGTCDTSVGVCSNPIKANGTACNDGNGGTIEDICTDGICAGTVAPGGDLGFESGAFGNGGAYQGAACTPACNTYGVASVTNTNPLYGVYSGKLMPFPDTTSCTCSTEPGFYWDFTPLVVGTKYRLVGYYKWVTQDASTNTRIVMICSESDCGNLYNTTGEWRGGIICGDPPSCQNGVLQSFAYDFVASSSTGRLHFVLVVGSGITNDYILLDNFSLTPFVLAP